MEIIKRYRVASLAKNLLFGVFLIVSIFGALIAFSTSTKADNERVVTIYHDGIEKTVVTSATTVSEVLERTNINVGDKDSVEPALDTKLVAPSYSVNIYRARPVVVADGAKRSIIMTPHTSGRKIAETAGIKVRPEDGLTLSRISNFVAEGGAGLRLTIARAIPINFVAYGKSTKVYTLAGTVSEFLAEKNIDVSDDDKVWPALDTLVKRGMTIAVYGEGMLEIKEERVPFGVDRILNSDKPVGYRKVQSAGKQGKRFVIYKVTEQNGKKVKTALHSYILVEPKKQVEVIGVKSKGFSGSFAEALAKLRQCEAGGAYDRNSGNGYYGAYQFSISTWAGNGGYIYPHEAPPELQDAAAAGLYQRRGWQPWPGCTAKLGLQDIYR